MAGSSKQGHRTKGKHLLWVGSSHGQGRRRAGSEHGDEPEEGMGTTQRVTGLEVQRGIRKRRDKKTAAIKEQVYWPPSGAEETSGFSCTAQGRR